MQRWTERLAPVGQSVLHLRWNLGVCGAMHYAVGLHAFQLLPQHLLRNVGNCALKIRKTHNLATEEMEKNDELPSAFEQSQRGFNISRGRRRRIALRHPGSPNILFRAYFPLLQYGARLLPVAATEESQNEQHISLYSRRVQRQARSRDWRNQRRWRGHCAPVCTGGSLCCYDCTFSSASGTEARALCAGGS